VKIFFYTSFALAAFALNSILCRLALRSDEVDAGSFTLIRIGSGALALYLISAAVNRKEVKRGNWISAFFLFAYAFCFSIAYIHLTAGTGALILFGCVQATMIFSALAAGERPGLLEWMGLAAALGGLLYLALPGLTSPPFISSAQMALAGIAWGIYTLRGRKSKNPLAETAGNFFRAAPMAALGALPFISGGHVSSTGFLLAVLSGAGASGMGYAIWYAALKYHTAARAAILQLAVPMLAAAVGIAFMGETLTMQMVWSSALILGGIAIAVFGRKKGGQ
jgi:drug/metabolite transporter (DMT)-like permease